MIYNPSSLAMGKVKESVKRKAEKYAKDHATFLRADGSLLYCDACDMSVTCERKSQVDQHMKTQKHKRKAEEMLSRTKKARQTFFSADITTGPESTFYHELCDTFVSANIPLFKINHPKVRAFLKKYCKMNIPDESTLRKHYVTKIYETKLERLRTDLKDEYVWVSIDETTDTCNRYVANVTVGSLKNETKTTPSLLLTQFLEKTNHTTIAQTINEALTLLWPDGIKYEKVLLLATDAAPYMKKAGVILNGLYPKMVHVTCVAHAFHNVAETVRREFPIVDKFIAEASKIFRKAPKRIQKFRELQSDIGLPPQPCLTRWATWLEAAVYYAENFEKFCSVVNELEDDSGSIIQVKEMIQDPDLNAKCCAIAVNFKPLIHALKEIQGQHCVSEAFRIIDDVKNSVVHEAASNKLAAVLEKNKGLKMLHWYNEHILLGHEVIRSECPPPDSPIRQWRSAEFEAAKYSPVVSCYVERCFSRYGNILTDQRHSLSEENLKQLTFAYCNQHL